MGDGAPLRKPVLAEAANENTGGVPADDWADQGIKEAIVPIGLTAPDGVTFGSWEKYVSSSQSALLSGARQGQGVSMPTEQELVDAKLSAAEARTETRIVELSGKMDRLTDLLTTSTVQLTQEVREVKADNKNTRWTIGITVVVTIIAALAALWTTQNNLIAAFSTGLGIHESQKTPTPPK